MLPQAVTVDSIKFKLLYIQSCAVVYMFYQVASFHYDTIIIMILKDDVLHLSTVLHFLLYKDDTVLDFNLDLIQQILLQYKKFVYVLLWYTV